MQDQFPSADEEMNTNEVPDIKLLKLRTYASIYQHLMAKIN